MIDYVPLSLFPPILETINIVLALLFPTNTPNSAESQTDPPGSVSFKRVGGRSGFVLKVKL